MSYGLFDNDFILKKTQYFNLELMKYASFLKKKRRIATLSMEFNPEQYTNFIYRQDFDYKIDYPLPKYKNLEYGGRAFHKAVYLPLDEEIEKCIPDTSIYEKFSKNYIKKQPKARFNSLMTGEHLRLSLDGKTIWKDFEKQLKRDTYHHQIYLYDYNLNEIKNAPEMIIEIGKFYRASGCGRMGNKFPIQIYNIKDLTKWLPVEHSYHYFQLEYNGLIKKEEEDSFFEYINNQGKHTVLQYNFTYNISYEAFLEKIIHFYHQIAKLRTFKREISLIYNKDFFLEPEWYKVILLIERFYTKSRNGHVKAETIKTETMIDFVENLGERRQKSIPIPRKEAKELLKFVKKENIELYEEFSTYHF